jgi:hypothetical protein
MPQAAEIAVPNAGRLLPSAVASLGPNVASVFTSFFSAKYSWQTRCRGAYCASTAFANKGTTFDRFSSLPMCFSQRAWRCCIAGASAEDKARAATMSSNAASSPDDSASEEVLLLLLLLLLELSPLLLLLLLLLLAFCSSISSKSGSVSE